MGRSQGCQSVLTFFCNKEQNCCVKCFRPPVLMLIVDSRMNKNRISKTQLNMASSIFLFVKHTLDNMDP